MPALITATSREEGRTFKNADSAGSEQRVARERIIATQSTPEPVMSKNLLQTIA